MHTFKSFETYNVKLSEIASGTFNVPADKLQAVTNFAKTIIAEILLMRKDVEVEFHFNLNMGSIYFGLNKSFPFMHNDEHEFIYPLDGSKSLAEVIDETMEYATYHKTSLPINEFADMFENLKVFDTYFGFNGELYNHIKSSSFAYTNIGYKDNFKGIDLVRMYGANPGVSFKKDDFRINVNNRSWAFDFNGAHLEIHKNIFLNKDSFEPLKISLIALHNLTTGKDSNSLDFLK